MRYVRQDFFDEYWFVLPPPLLFHPTHALLQHVKQKLCNSLHLCQCENLIGYNQSDFHLKPTLICSFLSACVFVHDWLFVFNSFYLI